MSIFSRKQDLRPYEEQIHKCGDNYYYVLDGWLMELVQAESGESELARRKIGEIEQLAYMPDSTQIKVELDRVQEGETSTLRQKRKKARALAKTGSPEYRQGEYDRLFVLFRTDKKHFKMLHAKVDDVEKTK